MAVRMLLLIEASIVGSSFIYALLHDSRILVVGKEALFYEALLLLAFQEMIFVKPPSY